MSDKPLLKRIEASILQVHINYRDELIERKEELKKEIAEHEDDWKEHSSAACASKDDAGCRYHWSLMNIAIAVKMQRREELHNIEVLLDKIEKHRFWNEQFIRSSEITKSEISQTAFFLHNLNGLVEAQKAQHSSEGGESACNKE